MGHRNQENERESGAALVEFALVLPFLVLLVLGIMEFGWALGQMNDIRYGAREGARLAAADIGSASAMRTAVCSSMDFSSGRTVSFTDGTTGAVGEELVVTVSTPHQSLSGAALISAFLPTTLSTTAKARIEQPSDSWSSESGTCP